MWLDKKNAQNKSQCVPSVPHVLERSNFIPFWCSLFGPSSGFFVMTCFIEGSCMEWLFSASESLIKLFSAQATILFISYARIHWSALYILHFHFTYSFVVWDICIFISHIPFLTTFWIYFAPICHMIHCLHLFWRENLWVRWMRQFLKQRKRVLCGTLLHH